MRDYTRTRSIAFRVPVSKEMKDEYFRISEAQKALDKDMAALLDKAAKHPEIATAARLTGYSNKPTIEPNYGSDWLVRLSVTEAIDEVAKGPTPGSHRPYVAPLNIAPQTANLLLNGKILTDDQKLALIRRMVPDLLEPDEPA
jgi:hypothetical protein